MTALPARNILDGTANPTTSTMKTALGQLRDYLNEQLGATGGAPAVPSLNGGQLAGLRNRIINGNFGINQRSYASGAAVGTFLYGHDRWKMAASADTYTYSTTANVTTVTIPASKVLQQVIEGANLESGTYTLTWTGTAQGKIGAGSYGASGVTGVIVGGTNTTIEFGPGTVSKVQFEFGTQATVFEQRPVGMELSLCQRYFWSPQGASGNAMALGQCISTSSAQIPLKLPVPMRANPTLNTITVGNYVLTNNVGTGTACAAVSLASSTLDSVLISAGLGSGPLTAGNATVFGYNSTVGFPLSAEL